MKINSNLTINIDELNKFQNIIGIKFNAQKFLIQSLLHGTTFNGNKLQLENFKQINNLDDDNYEKLEYLGDSVLNLIVAEDSYNQKEIEEYAKVNNRKIEGVLTEIKTTLVSNDNLKPLADQMQLDKYILYSGLEKINAIYPNVIEALIGGIFLDQGYPEAKKFVYRFFDIKGALGKIGDSNPVGKFQETAIKLGYDIPEYLSIDQWGPDNDKHFRQGLYLDGILISEGEGSTKKKANKMAAEIALKKLGWA